MTEYVLGIWESIELLCINLKTKSEPLEPYREQKGRSQKSPGCAEGNSKMCNSDGELLVNDKTAAA